MGNVSSETEQHLKHEFRTLGRDASDAALAAAVGSEIDRLSREVGKTEDIYTAIRSGRWLPGGHFSRAWANNTRGHVDVQGRRCAISRMGPCGPIRGIKKAVHHNAGWDGFHPLVAYCSRRVRQSAVARRSRIASTFGTSTSSA